MTRAFFLLSIPLLLLSIIPFLHQKHLLLPPFTPTATLTLTYILGILTPTLLVPSLTRAAIWLFTRGTVRQANKEDEGHNESSHNGRDSSLYGLDHAVLNVDMSPRTMWMNMGYWKVGSSFCFFFPSLTAINTFMFFPFFTGCVIGESMDINF